MARHRWPHAQNGCRHGMKQRGAASMASCPDRSNQGSEPGDCGKCLRISLYAGLYFFLSISSCFFLHSSILSPRAQSFSLPSRPSRTEPLPAPYYSLRRSHFAPLFPLPSRLLICQAALRSCHLELRIRQSIHLPIHSTLCLTIPGPAECAKRLNNNNIIVDGVIK